MAIATQITVLIAVTDKPDAVQDRLETGNHPSLEIANLIRDVVGGNCRGKVHYYIDEADGTAASGTLTCTQANADAGDYCTVNGITFTVATSPDSDPSKGQFSAGASDNAMATNLGAAINAHPKLFGLLAASVATNVVTCTMSCKGVHGNAGTLTTSDATAIAVSGANLASGAVGTLQKAWTNDLEARTYA